MKFKIFVSIICAFIFSHLTVHSQILSKTFSKYDSLSSIAYKMTVKEKDLFSDKLYNDTLNVISSLPGNKNLFKIIGNKNEEIYDGSKLIKMDLNNFTYAMESTTDGSIKIPYLT